MSLILLYCVSQPDRLTLVARAPPRPSPQGAPVRSPACPRLPCPSYGPGEPADGVVELDAGEAAALGIREGSAAVIRLREPEAP